MVPFLQCTYHISTSRGFWSSWHCTSPLQPHCTDQTTPTY